MRTRGPFTRCDKPVDIGDARHAGRYATRVQELVAAGRIDQAVAARTGPRAPWHSKCWRPHYDVTTPTTSSTTHAWEFLRAVLRVPLAVSNAQLFRALAGGDVVAATSSAADVTPRDDRVGYDRWSAPGGDAEGDGAGARLLPVPALHVLVREYLMDFHMCEHCRERGGVSVESA